jgi:hypothetical protein
MGRTLNPLDIAQRLACALPRVVPMACLSLAVMLVGTARAAVAPKVTNVTINDGTPQRSRVTFVQVDFSQVVTANPGAFQLVRPLDNAVVTLSVDLSASSATSTRAILTFSGANTEFGSLADGRYRLTIVASAVSSPSGQLDGDGDGTGGDDYVLESAPAPGAPSNIWRFFGDGDGDGDADAFDFLQFRSVFAISGPVHPFDYEADGDVDIADFSQFRSHFLLSLVP